MVALLVTLCVVGWEVGIYKGSGFAPTSVYLVFFVLSASETGLLLVVKLRRNVVMTHAGVKTMHQVRHMRVEGQELHGDFCVPILACFLS